MDNNKLIAEFMGYKIKPHNRVTTDKETIDIQDLEFHSSWDWLMPVAEKIRHLEVVENVNYNLTNDFCIETQDYQIHNYIEKGETDIQMVYCSVVQFIKWYNAQMGNCDICKKKINNTEFCGVKTNNGMIEVCEDCANGDDVKEKNGELWYMKNHLLF